MSLLYASFALLLFGEVGTAISLDSFYPFGEASNDSLLLPNDDDFSSPITLRFPFPFFGSRRTTLFVSLILEWITWHAVEFYQSSGST